MKMKRLKHKDPLYQPNISIFTKIIFVAGIIALGVQLFLGLRHINDIDAFGRRFATLTLIEASFAFIGLMFTDLIRGHSFPPERFRDLHPKTVLRSIVFLLIIMVSQIVIFFVPLAVRDAEIAAGMIFAAICEEIFFRAFGISIFVRLGRDDKNKIRLSKNKEISFVEILGIFITSLAFMSIHVNYWNNSTAMLTVFSGGVILAILYWYFRDLTSITFAHLILNMIVVGQNFNFSQIILP